MGKRRFVPNVNQVMSFMTGLAQGVNWEEVDPRWLHWMLNNWKQITLREQFAATVVKHWQESYKKDWLFSVWKEIEVGNYKDESLLRQAISAAGYGFSRHADWLLESQGFILVPQPRKVRLVKTTVGDLCGSAATLGEAWDRASSFDLVECPKETAPQLCLQYDNQPEGGRLIVVSSEFHLDEKRSLFVLERDERIGRLSDFLYDPSVEPCLAEETELVFAKA